MNYIQIAILFLQGSLIAFVLLILFHLRKRFGIGILYACLGLFQFMQVFLSSTVYVTITNNFLVSPGSTVMFTAGLFALLIIYIKEDANETKKLIYTLLIINIIMSILLQSFSWNIKGDSTFNPFNVSTLLFDNHAWSLFIGTVGLFLDSLLIIILFEFISRHIRFLFLQISLTMVIVVSFDTLFFSILAFSNFDNLNTIIISGLISKTIFALFYSLIFYSYLRYFDLKDRKFNLFKVKDVFQPLTYKQKFESAAHNIKKAEEEIEIKDIHYRTLTDISPVGIFHARSDGYTTFVNNRWCEISNVKQEDALGWGWLSALHPDDKPIIKQEWDLALAQKRISEVNYRFIRKDGSVKWVLGSAVPEHNSQKQLIGFVGTITDITELKLFQQEQVLLREKADQSNRLKSAFLANMSHEIRTPMNGILGFASLLKEPNLSGETQQDYIKIIEKSGARMLNMINDIVSISKIESGLVEVSLKELNVNEQQEYLYTFFKPEAEAKKIDFSFNSSLSLKDSIVKTDQDKFMSIYINLIKNAIKYTEKGSIEFGYTKKNNFIEFYIKDTGIGIESDRQEAIFERFIQADIEDEMARQGAGLGLSISKAYVEMLGGKIWLESKSGEGSIFYFTIPYNTEPVNIDYTENTIPIDEIKNQIKNLKILIVEDDKISALLIKTILEEENYNILQARNGIEAVELCQKNLDIDLVLMDIKMPKMDGYEATRQIRQFNKEVIIIAQSAHALLGDKEKSVKAGCNAHLSKPINKAELFSTIKHYLIDKL
ncbi:response regulator [Ancylomarina sp. 16SWW S1-10-2]|uniref:response regulator n=1 Tax=Ancylomarina sp. 16SWW S1-10-2 TaxID=2499681 RepID=UPI0012AE8DE4|nr:response regulator [Ancylomarina sp. 16SWW S1-10-2]MRT92249.1 response regulator [Ancylomarina sp. 16SWW S1-10-2]